MEIDVFELLKNNGMLLLFLVIGLGYLLGNLKIGQIAVGPTIGVLLAALIFAIHGRPRFAKLSIDDFEKVKIAAIHPDFT